MPSFDVVSELDKHEVQNAVDNAIKDLDRRYDLKGKGSFEFKDKTDRGADRRGRVPARSHAGNPAPGAGQAQDRREVPGNPGPYASGKEKKQEAKFREGIDKDLAKKIVATIKDGKLKVQAAIQGEQVRVTGKKRDDLQEAIALLRTKEFDMPLQFNNFRD
jgi:Uncharacterized protein conserved in bacteria